MLTIEQLLDSIRTRPSAGIYGIGVASSYLKSMGACLTGGGFCPTNIFKNATPDLWAKELADSDGRLTYCDESTSDSDFMQKSVREGTDITPGAILEYDCVLSSKRQDRDRDIIEQKGGLELDLKQPALWQHNQLAPIGKLVKVLSQDEFYTKCRYALADTELGRDAATLVKFGALRKSIGFKPSEFSPIEIVKNAQGVDVVRGWHIKKAMGMEGSLVSIPANADANILGVYAKQFDGLATAFSRGELKNELVKHWAKGLYDLRPIQVAGADLTVKGNPNHAADGKFSSGGGSGGASKVVGDGHAVVGFSKVQAALSESKVGDTIEYKFGDALLLNIKTGKSPIKKLGYSAGKPSSATLENGVKIHVDEPVEWLQFKLHPAASEAKDFTVEMTKAACGCGTPAGTKSAISAEPSGVDAHKETPCPAAGCKGVLDHSGTCVACGYKQKSAAMTADPSGAAANSKKCPGCDGDMEGGKCKKCGKSCEKSIAPLTSKMYGAAPYPAGSFEAIQFDLRGSAKAYLEANGVAVGDAYVDLIATLADSAVVCINPYTAGRKQACYQIPYTVESGTATWSGTPAEVSIEPQIVAKSLGTLPSFDVARMTSKALEWAHPAKLARHLIAKSCVDAEAVAAVREVARMVPVHDLKSSASFDSLFTK